MNEYNEREIAQQLNSQLTSSIVSLLFSLCESIQGDSSRLVIPGWFVEEWEKKIEEEKKMEQGLANLHFTFEDIKEEEEDKGKNFIDDIDERLNEQQRLYQEQKKEKEEKELQQFEQEVRLTRERIKLRNDLEYEWEEEERKKALKIIRYIQNRGKACFKSMGFYSKMLCSVRCNSLGIDDSFWIEDGLIYGLFGGYVIVMDRKYNNDICEMLNKYSDDVFLIGWRKSKSGDWFYDLNNKDRTRK